MRAPRRIQRVRGRRWQPPEGAIYVGRPTVWGNPFRITRSSDFHGLAGSWYLVGGDGRIHHPDEDTQRSARSKAVQLYADLLAAPDAPVSVSRIQADLADRDLVCWCPRDEPCHADVLLELANSPAHVLPQPTRRPQAPPLSRRWSTSDGGDQY